MQVLHVHRAERADALIAALAALLADAPADPFAPELIAVPTRGMERWLTQRLSAQLGASAGRGDGVCANVEFPFPGRLAGDAAAAAAGIDADADPWRPERAIWPLLDVVEANLDAAWLAPLAAHLDERLGPYRARRRLAAVSHLAALFDRYAQERPELVLAWAGGGQDGSPWQAELWRRLRQRIGTASPAERLAPACEQLIAAPGLVDLPERFSLFGLTRLPAAQLTILRALASAREVHLFLLHPSPGLWSAVASEVAAPVLRRADDPTQALARNRLLASWGQDARELQLVVGDAIDHHHPVAESPPTLLGLIQADIRADRRPPGVPLSGEDARPLLADDSVQVHACHGKARQVEVLRDAILHLLADDPTLEPRDVIVMCPDIEAFAPLIHATFGAGHSDDDDSAYDEPIERGPDLRVRLADRALKQTNPILGAVSQLLELAETRLTASQVLDFADREPVRRRFRLDDDDLARVEEWVSTSGVRWGLDAAHRAPFKLEQLEANTWRKGLDRMLVGVALSEERPQLFGGVLPLDDVDNAAIDLAGRFAELLARLETTLDMFAAPQPIDDWAQAIGTAARQLTDTGQRETWQFAELDRLLADVVQDAKTDGIVNPTLLALAEVRGLLAERLRGRPTRANFRTGHLTVCTLVPMRSVPHRVVCLLGLDDALFPRKAPRDGDDLLLDDPHVGDRDARAEDRQLLLDALMAATDRLIITYTGNDERNNTQRPPAVPVGELLDTVERTVRTAAGTPARKAVVIRHPLQPFDPRNFTDSALVDGRRWSFDQVTLAGAAALAGDRTTPGPFLRAPLPPREAAIVELDALLAFVRHPVKAFLRQRLGVRVSAYSDAIEDAMPVELDPLEQWDVGERMVRARLQGADIRAAYRAEIARGALPPGKLGQPVIEALAKRVEQIVFAVDRLVPLDGEPGSVDVRVDLGDGRVLSGTVPDVCGDVLRSVSYSRVSAKHRIVAWVSLLALTAARPERAYRSATIGRARYGASRHAEVTLAQVAPVGGEAALAALLELVDLYDRGMREPAPLYLKTSAAYAAAAVHGGDPEQAVMREWESEFGRPKEDAELEHQLVNGSVLSVADLLDQPTRDDEWDSEDPSRVGTWARRLWHGLLAREELSDQ